MLGHLFCIQMGELYAELCSYENLELAFKKARKGKTLRDYVIKFEENLEENLNALRIELITKTYNPKPLETFVLRDPKTRTISKADFRDRVIHHAVCNIIEPMFDKTFIYDSYANRKGKGTLNAVKRFDFFKRKTSKNNTRKCFVLKADIKHYFETVEHEILLSLIKRKVKDDEIISLIRIILENHNSKARDRGMPLGNLTSQFFANLYLNELDQFVKHKLRAKYYIRYVDDFLILHSSKQILEEFKNIINSFLKEKLNLKLHPDKSRILELSRGVGFLGFRIFYHHKLVRKKNVRKFEDKFRKYKKLYKRELIDREKVVEAFDGWLTFASNADTYKYRKHLVREFNKNFPIQDEGVVIDVKKHENFINKTESSNIQFTIQKTLQLFKKGVHITNIAKLRNIKVSTVWSHLANLIEYNQVSLWKVMPKDKISTISPAIRNKDDKLKEIKEKIKDKNITYDEISCVLAFVKSRNRKRNICHLVNWYRKVHCFRKCYYEKRQRAECSNKLKLFISGNPHLELTRDSFLQKKELFIGKENKNKAPSRTSFLEKKKQKSGRATSQILKWNALRPTTESTYNSKSFGFCHALQALTSFGTPNSDYLGFSCEKSPNFTS